MSLIIDLHPQTMGILHQSALQNNKSPKELVTQTLESIFNGRMAYIILEPAPSSSQMMAIKSLIGSLLNPEKCLVNGEAGKLQLVDKSQEKQNASN